MREEQYEIADSLYRRWFPDTEPPLHEHVVIAHLRRDSLLLRRLLADAVTAPGRRPGLGGLAAARYFRAFDTADSFAGAGLKSSRTPELLAFHHRTLGELATARGRRGVASVHLVEAERLVPAMLYQRALCTIVPFLPVGTGAHELIQRLSAQQVVPTGTELERSLAPHVRLYLLGLLNSAVGDYGTAAQHADALAALPVPTAGASVVRGFIHTIRGDMAWRRGRFAEAITALEPVNGDIPSDLLMSAPFAQEHARYIRADSYLQLGNHQEALRWFSNGFAGTPTEAAYMAPVQLRLGEVYDALGDRVRAAHHYARAISLWDRADADVSALLNRARQRHRELTAPNAAP